MRQHAPVCCPSAVLHAQTAAAAGVRGIGKDAPTGAELASRIGNLGFLAVLAWQARPSLLRSIS